MIRALPVIVDHYLLATDSDPEAACSAAREIADARPIPKIRQQKIVVRVIKARRCRLRATAARLAYLAERHTVLTWAGAKAADQKIARADRTLAGQVCLADWEIADVVADMEAD